MASEHLEMPQEGWECVVEDKVWAGPHPEKWKENERMNRCMNGFHCWWKVLEKRLKKAIINRQNIITEEAHGILHFYS